MGLEIGKWGGVRRLFVRISLATVTACSAPPPDPVVVPRTAEWAHRGKELVEGLAACGFCHGEERTPSAVLAGGLSFIFDSEEKLPAPNITSSTTGVGSWSDDILVTVMRGGVPPRGVPLHPSVHAGYEWMSTRDLLSIVTYLRTIPPIEREIERPETSLFDDLVPDIFDDNDIVEGYVPDLGVELSSVRGKYLTDNVARCGVCHDGPDTFLTNGVYLGGGRKIEHEAGTKIAPDISGSAVSGLGSWSSEDFRKFLQTGVTAEGRRVDPRFCPVGFYRRASQQDISDIAAYLHRVTP
jgi:hypothetical protein